jgi:ABC-type multidrug transport system fused ATPase/permease subunit
VSTTLTVDDLAIGWDRTLDRHLSFRLGRGDLVGVAGPSGGGKSTLALTLARLIAPRFGDLRLGDVDYADLAASDIRTRIGLSGQDDVLFDTTIRENLKIADPEATDAAMTDALTRAGLGDFIRGLPLGLDTPVGEHGNALSGGERKRVTLARLLLGRHEILVLDEPTEHLDEPTAAALLADIASLTADHGVMIISHSPMALAACQRVVHVGQLAVPVGV